ELLGALVTVELDMKRGVDGKGLRATASLKDGKRSEIGNLSAESVSQNASDLADELARLIAKQFGAQPLAASPDRVKEAERFAQEAKFLDGNHEFAEGIRALEAAVALDAGNYQVELQLGEFLARQ